MTEFPEKPKASDISVRKVSVLRGRARDEATKQGLKEDDLVIVRTIIESGLPEYRLEKIEGEPLKFLEEKYLNVKTYPAEKTDAWLSKLGNHLRFSKSKNTKQVREELLRVGEGKEVQECPSK